MITRQWGQRAASVLSGFQVYTSDKKLGIYKDKGHDTIKYTQYVCEVITGHLLW